MKKIVLGKTGIVTPQNAFGALPVQRRNTEDAVKILRKAYEGGITFFDTARAYTDSEEKIGLALSDVRKEIFIASKTMAKNLDEMKAQIEKLKSLGLNPSHIDNHMGSLYGVATGRFELLELMIKVAGEYKLPLRMPMNFTEAQFANTMLDVQVPPELVKGLIDKVVAYGKSLGVAMPDYLMPGDWSGPQKDSYENFKEYIYEMYRGFPEGVVETYIHPAYETDELKGTTGCWERRVWEYKLFSDPQTKQHIDSLGIKLINYRDLNKMRNG